MKMNTLLQLAATLIFSIAAWANPSSFNVEIEAQTNKVNNDQDVFVNVTIHNTSNETLKILKWYLPNAQGEIEDDIFSISLDGKAVTYLGRHYKRPAPTPADYMVFQPNQKRTFKVELSGVYDFTEMGQYEVQFSAKNFDLFGISNLHSSKGGKAPKTPTMMKSNNATYIYVQGVRNAKRCNPRKEDCGGGGGETGDVTFTGACSNSEQNSIMSALTAAKGMANDSVSYLNGNAGTRYTTWFGTYTSSRFNTVASNFDAIKDALDNKPKTFDCSCNQSYFAYVYPSQPYKVYLCRAFWSANTTGTDSKAGTIIHEMSHFNVVAGTDDVVYGQTGAKNLAISDPNSAIKNADSHEYFAENTPNLN